MEYHDGPPPNPNQSRQLNPKVDKIVASVNESREKKITCNQAMVKREQFFHIWFQKLCPPKTAAIVIEWK